MLVCSAVARSRRELSAHSACAQNQRGWQAKDHVRHDEDQGYLPELDTKLREDLERRKKIRSALSPPARATISSQGAAQCAPLSEYCREAAAAGP